MLRATSLYLIVALSSAVGSRGKRMSEKKTPAIDESKRAA